MTLFEYLPEENDLPGRWRDIPGTQLRVYGRIVDPNTTTVEETLMSLPPPPEPGDTDEFDKEFARGSMRLTMPR